MLLPSRLSLLAGALVLSTALASRGQDPPKVSFTKEVAPVLVGRCLACHGKTEPKGEYQVLHFESTVKEGIVVAGKPDESDLIARLIDGDPAIRMPKDADPLTAEQIALIRRWVSEGASFDGADPKAELASIIPKAPQPDPPAAYRAAVPITALAFHPQGTEIAVGGYHEITVWNTADGSLLRRIKNVAQRTYGLVYNADGSFLAAASGTPGILGEVKLFNPADGSLIKDLCGLSDVALDVAFSPQGDKLAACSADRTIRVFDVASGAQDLLIEDHADWVMAVAWSPDGSRLASASRDKTSKVFDAKTGESQITYPGHGDTVYGVAFAADGQQVLTGGADRKIHAWAVADAKKTGEAGGFGHDVYKVILAEGQIFAPSADKQAHQFAADSKNPVRKYSGHSDWVYSISFCPATRRLAAGSFDGEVRIWNTEDGAAVLTFKAAPGLPPSSPPAG